MEKLLHLYKYVDGVNDSPFPSKEQQATLYEFKYDAKRMGNAPTITGTLMHPLCLDELWGNNEVYVSYNGERYFIKQTPTSSYSNDDTRYKHECDFVSERVLLNDVYFYDVVTSDVSNDKPVSNSSNVVFYGDIHELAKRLNYSLQYAKLEYSVVVDEGITSESKLVSFQKQFFANVLQEGYKLFEIPYYFDGKVIHFGYTNNTIDKLFSYGAKDALLSISKNNITQRIINRITGVGSADNIPYYYPNFDPKGVSEVLYNGKANDLVSVENLIKYKKVKLGDTFIYNYESDKVIEYVDKSKYVVSKDITLLSENYETTKRYELVLDFPFSVDIAPQSSIIELDYSKSFLTNFKARLYRNLELRKTFTSFGETPYYELIKGEYNFSISLEFTFGEFDEKTELTESDIPSIVDALTISITSDVSGFEQWTLNTANNIVKLNDYGLKLNTSPKNGDKITFKQLSYIPPQPNLMPPIYRETLGAERFYNALNNTYYDRIMGSYYSFDNLFMVGKNKEDDVLFEDIKPSIKGVTNSYYERIDVFSEFAWDENDNDEFDEEGNYLHPYFFGKLRLFDGEFGFNLFDHAIEEDEMVISMTSGSCGGCNFIIGVDDESQKNIVQVDENGNLKRDANGNVLYGSPQERQNDTSKYEVWVALKKDIETFGVIMPNATNNYRPSAGDTFVILHIDLPNAYILAAEERLREELIKYMKENNSEKFNFSLSFSRIFFAENPTILAQLNENARIKIAYNNNAYTLYVSSYSYSMNADTALPEIRVELSEELAIVKESIVKQLANASLYLNKEVQRVNTSVATTNTTISKNTATAQASITKTNARVENVEKVVMNLQSNSGSGGGQGGINEEQLENYLTTNQYAKKSDIPSLDAYAKSDDVANTYATKSALKGVSDSVSTLREDFDNLNDVLNGNVGGVIDTWNEVVAFLDGYSQSDDLAAILSGMNTDIANRVLIEDFEKLKEAVNPLFGYFDATGNANNALKLGGHSAEYFATADALNTHITAFNNYKTATNKRLDDLEALWYMDDDGNVHTTHNIVVDGGGAFGMGAESGDVPSASVSIKFEGSTIVYSPVDGIITLPAYPSAGGGVADSVDWAKVTGKPTTLSGYGITDALSVNGGTIDSTSEEPITINSNQAQVRLLVQQYNTSKSTLGWHSVFGTWMYDHTTGKSLGIRDTDGTPFYYDTTFRTLIHSGNIGTYNNGYIWNSNISPFDYHLNGTYIYAGGAIANNWPKDWGILINNGNGIGGVKNQFYAATDGTLYWRIKYDDTSRGWYELIHSGNYSNYALSLNGGTINGPLNISSNNDYKIILNNTDAETNFQFISFRQNGVQYGSLGTSFDGILEWNGNDIIHSGNIGSQSVNSANSANYSYGLGIDNSANVSGELQFMQFSSQNAAGDLPTNDWWHIIKMGHGNADTYFNRTLAFSFWSNRIYTRNRQEGIASDWEELAFLSSNVASATKLQTARSIWGQSFDGTSDVDGNIAINSDAVLERKSSAVWLNYGPANKNENLYLFGYDTQFYYGTASGYRLAVDIKPTGNVLIGTTTDWGYKLGVYGATFITGNADHGILIGAGNNTIDAWRVNGNSTNLFLNWQSSGHIVMGIGGGNVLIGTTTDSGHKLRVDGGNVCISEVADVRVFLSTMTTSPGVNTYNSFRMGRFDENTGGFKMQFGGTDCNLEIIDYNWKVSLFTLSSSGNLTVAGGGAFGSDIRYKDITSYRQLDLETIVNAPLFTFKWTDREDKVEHLGTSAQYWLDTQFKDAVNTANKDFFHLDYGALAVGIGISVAREVKGVKTEVELLRDEVRQLRKKLKEYETYGTIRI